MKKIIENLNSIYNKEQIFINESMKKHTSFKIGGFADILVIPVSLDQIVSTINLCRNNNNKYFVMGNGSNLLVSDKGIRGLVIKIGKEYNRFTVEGETIIASSGILLSNISKIAMENGLMGMEFASGIPGTIGGGVVMNAGAYGGEMKGIVETVKVLDESGNIRELSKDQLNFEYRKSVISDSKMVILEVKLKLKKGSKDDIKIHIDDLTNKRNSKQPLNMPSAGSTFKRPVGNFAGKLIDDSGLRGLRHGDAMISEKHCGFVINAGNATSQQVRDLIETVQKIVFDNYGIRLEPEVKIIGED